MESYVLYTSTRVPRRQNSGDTQFKVKGSIKVKENLMKSPDENDIQADINYP